MEEDNWSTPLCQHPRDLLSDDRRTEYLNYGLPLYKAAIQGDWEAARQIHSLHQHCFATRITKDGDTALHIAAVAMRTDFVEQLVQLIVQENCTHMLALRNKNGNTALCLAAASGSVAIAKVMVDADKELLKMAGNKSGLTPLHMAALLGKREMVNYLLEHTQDYYLPFVERSAIFISTINSDLYDVALDMLRRQPKLAMARDVESNGETPLHILAKKRLKPSESRLCRFCSIFKICGQHKEVAMPHQALELVERLWELVLTKTQSEIESIIEEPWEVIFAAIEVGNVEFVTTLLRSYPDLLWKVNKDRLSIFHVAVIHRQEKIFSLIYEIGAIKDLLVTFVERETNNSILHLAAMKPSPDRLNCISGAALQMQREMLWFKVVKDLVMPQAEEAQNSEGKTPATLFTEQHKQLREAGEEWMRKTAGSCIIVATLIASAVFGFILKVPHNDAVSLKNPLSYSGWYWVFAICDSLSLITSTASTLVFLSILISRYAEKDFLESLPRKLIMGLALLFLSIVSIALTTTFHIVFNQGWPWFGIILLVFITIFHFTTQELSLMWEVFSSTMGNNSSFQSPTPTLFRASSQRT